MNILAVNSLQFDNRKNWQSKAISTPYFGLVMAKPLQQDTVSFGATAKKLTDRGAGVSLKTARKIHNVADELQEEIVEFVNKFFKDLIVTEDKPNNLIEYIKGRTKSPESIVEKSATRNWNNMADIFTNMTDLNGIKIVLRDGSKANVKQILKRFEKAIESGVLICTEIENKVPIASKKLKGKDSGKWNYATYDTLDGFRRFAENETGKKMKFEPADYTDANYTAIHFLFRFPGQKRAFEVQLMGRNVATFKDMDDIIFKILNNKNVDKAYQPMVALLKPLKVEDDIEYLKMANDQLKDVSEKLKNEKITLQIKQLLQNKQNALKENIEKTKRKIQISELFNKYRSEAFLFQRDRASLAPSRTQKEYFLPLIYDIPEEYDFNNLYALYKECAAKAAKNKSRKN